MSRKAFTFIELLVVVAIIAILAAILYPVFQRGHDGDVRRAPCQSNLKQIGLGFIQYTQDYDENMPILGTPGGWKGLVMPYVKSQQLFQCPSEATSTQNATDYPFNSRLDGRSLARIKRTAFTILSMDGNDGTDATSPDYNLANWPKNWRTDSQSPAYRHNDVVANYLFADGHVKAFAPAKVGATARWNP